jgi:ABC-type branched-subunit amino acid transport system substrate-binding protein
LSVGTQFFEPAQTDPYHVQKLEIAKDITSGKTSLAMSELQKLTQLTSDSEKNDAEALIYQEDQRILLASLPYITVVLGMDFSPSLIGGTHDTLQGAYTEQHLWNTTCQGQTQLLLVLANTGSNSISRDVIGQIAKLVGIIGWENSTDTINAIHALGAEQIPLISPSASDTEITGKFFLRMVPSNSSQASFAVTFAAKRWPNAQHAAIITEDSRFVTSNYPIDLASYFSQDLPQNNITIPPSAYTFTNDPETIKTALTNALNAKPTPDLIFFAGYAPDLQTLLDDQSTLDQKFRNIPIITGDAASIINDYHTPFKGFDHTYFTTFASQDEWNYEQHSSDPTWTNFTKAYIDSFNTSNTLIDSDVMLTYDAMNVLLEGYQKSLNEPNCHPFSLSCQVAAALPMLPSYQGVSGQISFEANNTNHNPSDPVKKAIVIAQITKEELHTVLIQGCFFTSSC